MAKYDLNLLLLGTLTDEQIEQVKSKVAEIVMSVGGKIDFDSEVLRRRLAYVIDKVRNGIYVKATVEIDKERIEKLKQEIKLLAEVLRFSFIAKNLRMVNKKRILKHEEEVVEGGSFLKTDDEFNKKDELKDEKRVSMEELDQKIDEILDAQSIN